MRVPRPVLRHRRLVALLLLPGLLLRALVPVGFMPGSGTGVGIVLELCTAHGLQRFVVQPDGDTAPAAPASHADNPCAFALTAVAAPPPAAGSGGAGAMPTAAPPTAFRSVAAAPPPVRARSPRGPPPLA